MKKRKQMHVTNLSTLDTEDVKHPVNLDLTATKVKEIAIWGYLMPQYNLKAGWRKFGNRAADVAIMESTQLHIMDMCAVMDPSKLTKEGSSKALLLPISGSREEHV